MCALFANNNTQQYGAFDMKQRRHHYVVTVKWTGNRGSGTSAYDAYDRSYDVIAGQREIISGSSDPAFRGDGARWNPELLLVAALSTCHKLWYLHLCADAGVVVLDYVDDAEGVMLETAEGSGQFVRAVLHPRVVISSDSDPDLALSLHARAHEACFIANSVNFPVEHEAAVKVSSTP
jgi:organic hydroperoxide reductase OsmC/OhrA